MREPMLLTTGALTRLDLEPGENDVWIWDADGGQHSGLGVRLRRGKTGVSKTFYAAYRFAGQDRRDRLGDIADYTLADARHRVYELRRSVADNVDPREAKATKVAHAVKATACPTFEKYVETYLAMRRTGDTKLRAKTYRERERYLASGAHSEPLKKLRLNQIDKTTIATRINFLENTGITNPSRHVAQAWRMAVLDVFKFAMQDGHVDANPVLGTRQPAAPKKQKSKGRKLDPATVAAVWNATRSGNDYDSIVRLVMLLGCRRQEVGGMRASEIDKFGNWTLPGERAKNGADVVLPLPAAALKIVKSFMTVAKAKGRDHLFGRKNGGFTAWTHGKRALDKRLSADVKWRIHDLRHTFVTNLHDLGVAPHIVKACVGHSQGSDVHNKIYNDATYLGPKADALKLWADRVETLAAGTALPAALPAVA